MADKKKGDFRKHITAAKDWLGQAEESIDKENDIRSDLNLMLAQAELQRAKEKDDLKLWKKWLKWTLPWLAAIIIAAGYIVILRPDIFDNEQENNPVSPQQNLNQIEMPVAGQDEKPQEIDGGHQSTDEIKIEIPPAAPVHSEISTDNTIDYGNYKREEYVPVETVEQPRQEEAILPTDEMHRLMQSAGKSLRE